MELSIRLRTVAEAVTPGHIPADIGTDHGYVPIYLVKQGTCPKALAMDINPGPLARAKDHIKKEGLEDKIITRLSNGLEKLDPQEADSIIIAGMGGQLICTILTNAPHILREGKELILSPHSEWFKVRRFLDDHQYQIVKEWFIKEDGKYYVVIKAKPGSDPLPDDEPLYKEACDQYGRYLIEENNPLLQEYLEEQSRKKKAILSKLEEQGKEETSRYKELLYSVKIIDFITNK